MTTDTEVTITRTKKKEPPPKRARVVVDWEKIARDLKRHPGEWRLVFENGPTSTTSAVKAGGMTAIRPVEDYEFRTANNKRTSPRTCDFYMKYVGDKEK